MDKRLMEKLKKLMSECKEVNKYECDKCRDLGYVFVKTKEKSEAAKPCECLQKRRTSQILEKCGLSESFKKKTFATYSCKSQNQVRAKHKALIYCDQFEKERKSIILSGKSGAGKTHLGIAIMLKLVNQNENCKYIEYHDMMISLKQSVMDDINHMRELEKLLNPKVLFIDDFLKGNITPTDLNYIYRIINTRYITNKPVIISTEKTMEEILNWDEAVGSRLIEMAGENIICFDKDSENHRLKEYL